MHQTSSRLLRQTDDDRPFTRVSFYFLHLILSTYVSVNAFRSPTISALLNCPFTIWLRLSGLAHELGQWSALCGLQATVAKLLPALCSCIEACPSDSIDCHFFTELTRRQQDLKDLFSTLMVSLPLTPHRVRFTKVEHTFTTDEALTNLGSLKFSQSNRMPDPKDPSRIVTTTTTTTFSMAKEMARTVCNRFVEARFVESLDGKQDFASRSSVWQLTPKGMRVLTRFCQRNGIHQRHVNELLDSPRNMMQLVILEREPDSDSPNFDRGTIEVIFRRFVGEAGPNLKSTATADSDSVHEYATGLVGVRMIRARKQIEKDTPYIFTGKSAVDWIMDCCMVINRKECFDLAQQFLVQGFMVAVTDDRASGGRFQPVKNAHYGVTDKGMKIAGWIRSPNGSVNGEATNASKIPPGIARDSNTSRMSAIIHDAALRLLFREFLQETHCEENLTFYLEVRSFLLDYGVAKRAVPAPRLDLIRETLASAYSKSSLG